MILKQVTSGHANLYENLFVQDKGSKILYGSGYYGAKTLVFYNDKNTGEMWSRIEGADLEFMNFEEAYQFIPQEYILQVIWYLGITGKKKAYIAVLIGGQSFKYKEIEFDKELFDVMVQMAKDFWNSVQTKTPPAVSPSDNSVLVKMFPEHNSEMIENQEIEEQIAKLQQVKDDISALTDEKEMLEAEIKNTIGESLGVITDKYKVTWKAQQQTRVNTERLKADGLYDKYSDKSTLRKLYVSKKKAA